MIDTHVHVVSADVHAYPRPTDLPFQGHSYVHTVEDLLRAMDTSGVQKATVVQPFAVYGHDNSYQADSAAAHPDHLVSIGGVASGRDGGEALRRWVVERGVAGARITNLWEGVALTDDRYVEVCEVAGELGAPVCLLTSKKYLRQLADLARRVPGTVLVLDHLGWNESPGDPKAIAESVAALASIDNVYLKVTTPLLADRGGSRTLELLLARFGPERLLWGTNYPVTDAGGYAATVALSGEVLGSLPPVDRDWICTKTAQLLWPALAGAAT